MEEWHCENAEAAIWELALPLGLGAIFAVVLLIYGFRYEWAYAREHLSLTITLHELFCVSI